MSAVEVMYKNLEATGHQSSLRLTLKIMDGKKEQYFYDKGVAKFDDEFNQLSEMIVVGVNDNPRRIFIKEEGGIEFFEKNFTEIIQPRFLEGFIKVYGKKNVSVYEYGKYLKYKDYISELLN